MINAKSLVPSARHSGAPVVAWRLSRAHWGKGYATEGARAALEFAFSQLDLAEVVAFTVPENLRSLAVMRCLGMQYAGSFDHPTGGLPHVLYKITRP